MASWKDGAEYAPIERPDGFATPEAVPLTAAEPYRAATPGPAPAPGEFVQQVPVAPLGQLVGNPQEGRNPAEPFSVMTSVMTTETAWGGADVSEGFPTRAFDPNRPFQVGTESPAPWEPASTLPPPAGQPLSVPGSASLAPFPPNASTAAQQPATQAQLIIRWVAVVLVVMSTLVPLGAPLLLIPAGLLLLRGMPTKKGLASFVIASGVGEWFALLAFAQLAIEPPVGMIALYNLVAAAVLASVVASDQFKPYTGGGR